MAYQSEDEDAMRQKQPPPGALPSPNQSYDWAAILAYLRQRKGPFLAWSFALVVLVGLALFFATRSLNTVAAPPAPAPLSVAVNPAAHTGQVPNTTPLPGAVPTDANGNPIPGGTDTTGSITPPPPGMDSAEWQRYLAWRRRCPSGQCADQSQVQQQPQLTPAQQREEDRRKKMDDLMWNARNSKPDAGMRKLAAEQTISPGPPAASSAVNSMTSGQHDQQIQASSPAEVPALIRRNTCGPNKGPEYHLVAGITPIKARLLNAITGDAKGPVIAQTVEPTYSFDMTKVLIPKGAYLTGGYDRVADLDQERILLNVNTITMSDCQVKFEDVDVLDQSGMEGLRDKVNHHYASVFLTSIATAGIGAGAQFGGSGGYYSSPVDVLRIGFGMGASQAAQQTFSRWSNRRFSLTIRAGQEIVLFPPVDIPLGAWGDHRANPPL